MHTETSRSRTSDATIHQMLMNEAADLLLACLSSIPRDKIDPKKYWPHAQKALRIGAERGATYERMVSEIHGQLMDADTPFVKKTVNKIYSLGESLKSRQQFTEFRRLCRQNAPYIVLYARMRKEQMKSMYDPSNWLEGEDHA